MSGTAAQVAAHSRGSSPPPRRSTLAGSVVAFVRVKPSCVLVKWCRGDEWTSELLLGSERTLVGCG